MLEKRLKNWRRSGVTNMRRMNSHVKKMRMMMSTAKSAGCGSVFSNRCSFKFVDELMTLRGNLAGTRATSRLEKRMTKMARTRMAPKIQL